MPVEDLFADLETQACSAPLIRAFGFLGKRWNGVILATLLLGPLGFSALRRSIDGISDTVLSERLVGLAKAGLIQRTVHAGPPTSIEYSLTPAGQAILPAMDALATWSSENLPE